MTYGTTIITPGSSGDSYSHDSVGGVLLQRVKLAHGAESAGTDVSTAAPLPVEDWGRHLAAGTVTGATPYYLEAKNGDVDTSSDPEDFWSGTTALYVAPTADRVHQFASTSTDDDGDPAGTGALTLTVSGISGGVLNTETVTLNGTTDVATAASYSHLWFHVATAGSGGTNAGVITATADTDSTVTAYAAAGARRSHNAAMLIPDAKTGYLFGWGARALYGAPTAELDVRLLVDRAGIGSGLAFEEWGYDTLDDVSRRGFRRDFARPLAIPGGSWVKVQAAETSADNFPASAFLDLVVA